ncbi:MAG: hypothetical protein VW397_03420 [Candidatus Margulisiibacteriota bacterium]
MRIVQAVILSIFLLYIPLNAVTGNINVQFLIGDTDNGTFQGNYHITFGIFSAPNQKKEDALWKETHQLVVTQGKVSKMLGTQIPIDYHMFKSDQLYIGLFFKELTDTLFVPIISVPAAVVSKYSDYAREIEFTDTWMKINTVNHRVGIGITNNLTVAFQVVGSANITSVNATGEIHSPDGYNIHKLDYLKLVNLDDYSLSPFDNNDSPTVDTVFVTKERNVGMGIYITANIAEQLHVSGNLRLDNGSFMGLSNIQLVGDAGATEEAYNDKNQLVWDSKKGFLHAGYGSGNKWSRTNSGMYSAAFGRDNTVSGDYGFSVGKDNQVLKSSSTVGGGLDNTVDSPYSGVFSGNKNKINPTSQDHGKAVIAGGDSNTITGDYAGILGGQSNVINNNDSQGSFASIVGGKTNQILNDSKYSSILGGHNNLLYGESSFAMGKYIQIGTTASQHNGVFVFTDSTINSTNYFNSYSSDQFLIYASNGVVIGLDNFNNKADLEIKDFSPAKIYPPSGQSVKAHSIRTAGDIVAADADGNLGFLVGDGSYITNIASLWKSSSSAGSVYVDDQRIGIGSVNDLSPADSLLYIKETSLYPANIKLASVGGNTLDFGVSSSISNLSSSVPFRLQYNGNNVAEVTNSDNGEFNVYTNLGVGVLNPDDKLDVDGTAQITGKLTVKSVEASQTITANAFVGDGKKLTDVPVYYMSPQDLSPHQQLLMHNNGNLGLGKVTSNIQSLLHIGDETGTQIRLEQTDDTHNRYTTFSSNSRFNLTFNDYQQNSDEVFSFNSKKNGETTEKQLVIITGEGNVGIGKLPSNLLDVSGNIKANTFEGNGANVTNVQLNVDQTNAVTFNSTVSIKKVLKLAPLTTNIGSACDTNDDIGSIYTVQPTGKQLTVCICVALTTPKNILDSSADSDCQ